MSHAADHRAVRSASHQLASSNRGTCTRLVHIIITTATAIAIAIPHTDVGAQSISRDAEQYLDKALTTLERSSIHRKTFDWKSLRDSVSLWAAGATTPEATWPALLRAVRFVDPHGFLVTPRPMPQSAYRDAMPRAAQPSRPSFPETESALIGRVGLLVVPGFTGNNRPGFVDSLQQSIREFDKAGACGWIVDLRFNPGGNMWPMLAGIGPLLGTQRVGAFVSANGTVEEWHYRGGQAWAGDFPPPPDARNGVAGSASKSAHRLQKSDAPVALLLSRTTASSGEAVAVAFLGRPNLRAFGDSTAGMNSANGRFPLSDGAQIFTPYSMNRDRRGRTYALTIVPDELVSWDEDSDTDAPLERAKSWLLEQPHCASTGKK